MLPNIYTVSNFEDHPEELIFDVKIKKKIQAINLHFIK